MTLPETIGCRGSGIGCREERATTCLRIHPKPDTQHPKPARRGFTAAELIIGLLLLALLGGATAAVASAVSRGWMAGESSATSTLVITRTMLRIQDKMQRAIATGEWRAGSVTSPNTVPGAAVLFWRDDDNGDGDMQLEETQLLEYKPSTKQLLVWEVRYPNDTSRATWNGPHPPSWLSDPGAIENYRLLQHTRTYAITTGVLGAAFNVITPTSASQRRTFEFTLKFNGPNGAAVEYGTATARSSPAPAGAAPTTASAS